MHRLRTSLRNFLHIFFAWYGAIRYGFPSEKLLVIGVTGTSGKSSTIFLLRRILEQAGYRVGALSTIEFCIAGACELNDKKMTMLGRTQIQQFLRDMVESGCDIALIETTSEGFLQYRHWGINYDTIVLTNLYPEHIEAHGGFDNYKAAKLGIFRYVARCKKKSIKGKTIEKTAVVNGEIQWKDEFLFPRFDSKFIFQPQNYSKNNYACVAVVAKTLGVANDTIEQVLSSAITIPGRVEYIPEARDYGFNIVVDYAFEPVAIASLYDAIKKQEPKKIIHVLGATGGGRDKARRFTVGEYVGINADICIVTNEDPYDDDPRAIMNDVVAAIERTGKNVGTNLFIEEDRRIAIRKALAFADQGDYVLITGKGSEQGMVIKGKIIPWDDRRVVREELHTRTHA